MTKIFLSLLILIFMSAYSYAQADWGYIGKTYQFLDCSGGYYKKGESVKFERGLNTFPGSFRMITVDRDGTSHSHDFAYDYGYRDKCGKSSEYTSFNKTGLTIGWNSESYGICGANPGQPFREWGMITFQLNGDGVTGTLLRKDSYSVTTTCQLLQSTVN